MLNLYLPGVLAPVCCLCLALLLLLPPSSTNRVAICGVFVQAKYFTGHLFLVFMNFSHGFRTFLILYADRGLVRNGQPYLRMFQQLFWIISASFFVIMYTIFPLSYQIRGSFPNISKTVKICMLLPGYKVRIMYLADPGEARGCSTNTVVSK